MTEINYNYLFIFIGVVLVSLFLIDIYNQNYNQYISENKVCRHKKDIFDLNGEDCSLDNLGNVFKIEGPNNYACNPNKYHDPVVHSAIFDEEEIKMILDSCQNFENSTVFDNGKLVEDKHRTSKTCYINNNCKGAKMIFDKIREKFKIDPDYIEQLQLTRYYPGEYYNEHYDYHDPDPNDNIQQNLLENKGQRMKTIFVYLQPAKKGGETHFIKQNYKYNLNKGDAIIWDNVFKDGDKYILNLKSLHAGTPVEDGIKIGLNIWILDRKRKDY